MHSLVSTLHLACCANRSKVDDRLSDFQKREKVQELKKERFWECFASEDSTRAKIVTMILEQTAIDVNAIDDIFALFELFITSGLHLGL